MSSILVVDDVSAVAEQYAYDLRRLGDFRTFVASSGAQALDMIDDVSIDCMILDLEMPGMDGFDVLEELARRGSGVRVIVYTGTGDFDRCARAIRLGAHSFIDKAESMRRVVQEIRGALKHTRLESEVRELRIRVTEDTPLAGDSAGMRELRASIAKLAAIPSPVLILGESGTGKELVARELHRLGPHDTEPFIALNAAALPENLIESELFGHEKGAFTGADTVRRGAFEAAGTGTVFLDEIGDMPLPAQSKLLRVLEEREVRRVGGTTTLPVEARVIAATHRDLEAATEASEFRTDLFYRLNVHVVRVPPLRERIEDIPELADLLVASIGARIGMAPKRIAPGALARLMAYDWSRNNVRELRNVLERMMISGTDAVMEAADVPGEIGPGPTDGRDDDGSGAGILTFRDARAAAERRIVLEALARNDWRVGQTAAELGLADHASLLKIMRKHAIRRR